MLAILQKVLWWVATKDFDLKINFETRYKDKIIPEINIWENNSYNWNT